MNETKYDNEEIFITLNRKIALRLAPLFIRLGFTPNMITTSVFFLGIISAFFYSFGTSLEILLGAIALHFSFFFDHIDGIVARETNNVTAFGGWLDGCLDRIKETMIVLSICIGYINLTKSEFIFLYQFNVSIWLIAFVTISLILLLEYSLLLRREKILSSSNYTFLQKSLVKRILEPSLGKTIYIIIFFTILNVPVFGLLTVCLVNSIYLTGIFVAKGFMVQNTTDDHESELYTEDKQ